MSLPARRSDISIMTTSHDLGAVLLREITGNDHLGKSAVFHLARMHTNALEEADMTQIMQYLLLIGNRALYVSTDDISTYLKEGGTNIVASLEKAVLGEKEKPFYRARGHLCSIYRGIVSGSSSLPSRPERSHTDAYVPEYVVNIADELLGAFPLLQRMDLRDYEDVAATVELNTLLGLLQPRYRSQIHRVIEEGVRRYAQGEEVVYSPRELLVQAETAYVIQEAVEMLTPRLSFKHYSGSDNRLLLATILGRMMNDIDENYFSMRKLREDDDMAMYLLAGREQSWESYSSFHEGRHRRYEEERKGFSSLSEFRCHVNKVAEGSGLDRFVVEKIVAEVGDTDKRHFEGWEGLYTRSDRLAMLTLLYANKAVVVGEEIGLGARGESWDMEMGAKFSLAAGNLVERLMANFVLERHLERFSSRKDTPMEHMLYWHNPFDSVPYHGLKDEYAADVLMERYPVFTQLPVVDKDDVLCGILLSCMEGYELDTTATITQNFLLNQFAFVGGGRP